MKKLVCEMCEGTDFLKDGGVFVCQTCGCKYSLEEAKKMMSDAPAGATGTSAGPVTVDNSAAISNYLTMAQNAMEADNNEEAENYANKIIELDITHSEAWKIKGEAAGWQSTTAKPRLSDSVTAWINAVTYAEEDQKEELREEIAGKYTKLFLAMVSLNTGHFAKIQSAENKNSIKKTVDDGIAMMNMLLSQAGVSFNRAYTYNRIAKLINDAAVDGFKDAREDFGPDHSDMAKWKWERFTASCDECLELMEYTLRYVRDEDMATTICNNLVFVGETVRDSCSWKFNVNSWNSDKYDKDFSFTSEAKAARTKNINGWKEKKENFTSGRIDRVKNALQSGRVDEEEARGRAKYWEEHSDEKAALEKETAELQTKTADLKAQLKALPISKKLDETRDNIDSLEKQKASLGLFKGKEKKAIQEQIDQLVALIEQQKKEETTAKKPINDDIKANEARIDEIKKELTKSRGRISAEDSIVIPDVIADGKFAVTPDQFIGFLNDVLPKPLFADDLASTVFLSSLMGNRLGLNCKYQTIIKDSENKDKDGKPSNSGFVIQFQVDDDGDILAISLENGADITEKIAKEWAKVGSTVMMLLAGDTTRTDAENTIIKMVLDEDRSLFGVDDIRAEYASFNYTLLGKLTCTQHCILFRPKG